MGGNIIIISFVSGKILEESIIDDYENTKW